MKFVLAEEVVVEWPVSINVPQDGGSHQTQRFTAKFKIIGTRRAEEIMEANRETADAALLAEVFVGWGEDVTDEDGNPLEFTEARRDIFLERPYATLALVRAYFHAATGAKAKN